MRKEKLAVLCIDLQKEYFEDLRPLQVNSGKEIIASVGRLLDAARENNIMVVHIRHVSKDPLDGTFSASSPFVQFEDNLMPAQGELVITKSRPGAFYNTDLHEELLKGGITNIAICGLLSFMCCDTTAREAHARGYKVFFLNDATASIGIGNITAETIHEVTCAVQAWMFSEVITTNELIARINNGFA